MASSALRVKFHNFGKQFISIFAANTHKLSTSRVAMARVQTTSTILMIKPSCFNYNPLTAADNAFQSELRGKSDDQVQSKALSEFETLATKLEEAGVNVHVEEDSLKLSSDAVFPNNWVSFHQEGSIAIWPMKAENRRLERRKDIVDFWSRKLSSKVVDYTQYEREEKFLEGTGSMVLDRVNRVAYSCESQRTHREVLGKFCEDFGYSSVMFKAALPTSDGKLCPIYHTNVMMSVCDSLAVVCTETIADVSERERVLSALKQSGHEILAISAKQVESFAGNMLQVNSRDGRKLVVMSTRAFEAFTPEQVERMQSHCQDIVHSDLNTIETAGGGSARCMIAEVFPVLQ